MPLCRANNANKPRGNQTETCADTSTHFTTTIPATFHTQRTNTTCPRTFLTCYGSHGLHRFKYVVRSGALASVLNSTDEPPQHSERFTRLARRSRHKQTTQMIVIIVAGSTIHKRRKRCVAAVVAVRAPQEQTKIICHISAKRYNMFLMRTTTRRGRCC